MEECKGASFVMKAWAARNAVRLLREEAGRMRAAHA